MLFDEDHISGLVSLYAYLLEVKAAKAAHDIDMEHIADEIEGKLKKARGMLCQNPRYALTPEMVEYLRAYGPDIAIENAYLYGLACGVHYRRNSRKKKPKRVVISKKDHDGGANHESRNP